MDAVTQERYSIVLRDWHPTKNLPNHQTDFSHGSKKTVWWLGACGHEWDSSFFARVTNKQNCPFCAGKRVLAGLNDLASRFPEVAAEWHPTLNGDLLPTEISFSSSKRVWWQCSQGHEWDMAVNPRTSKGRQGCSVCAGKRVIVGVNDLASQSPDSAQMFARRNIEDPATIFWLSSKKVEWECDLGHIWIQSPARLGRSTGDFWCPVCNGRELFKGFNDLATISPHLADEWHPNKNSRAASDFLPSSRDKAWWVCSEDSSHEWEASIVQRRRTGCPVCSNKKVKPGSNDLATTHPEIAALWSPKNVLKPTEVVAGSMSKAWFLCPQGCDDWFTVISYRVSAEQTAGCKSCSYEDKGKLRATPKPGQSLADMHPLLVTEWNPSRNTLPPQTFRAGSKQVVWWICKPKGHEWPATISERTRADKPSGCPACAIASHVSKGEQAVADFLEGLGLTVIQSDRKLIRPKELDIFLPTKNIAIEYNGIYWHNDKMSRKENQHYQKWLACKEQGIQLVQVWEDEWKRNPEQVKRMLAHKLGMPYGDEPKVMARKTHAVAILKAEAEVFLDRHHVQGYANGSYYLGLVRKDVPVDAYKREDLLAVLVLKKEAGTEGKALNIIRYATAAVIPGGFTKLLKHAERVYQPERFITFSDNCVSDGGLYKNNGFVADKELAPDYMYVVGGERRHKFGYRLKRFRDDPALKWEEGLTERELAELNGLKRVWDAGKTRWVKECSYN